METEQSIKQRFGIIGNDLGLNRAIEKALQVAPTDTVSYTHLTLPTKRIV